MIEQIRELLHADPFVPFRIVLTSGNTYDVATSGLVAEGETQLIYCYPRSDRYAILRLNQLAAVETLDNGHAPKPKRKAKRK
jgi:hypothetical protein